MPKSNARDKDHDVKPYHRSTQTPPSDTFLAKVDAAFEAGSPDAKARSKAKGGSASAKYDYDKVMLARLIIVPVQPDWSAIAAVIGKTKEQTYDLWRKSLQPNLLSNKPWSTGSASDSKEVRIRLLMEVLNRNKIDWTALVVYYPGRTKSQLFDVWRKSILPRFKRGDTVE